MTPPDDAGEPWGDRGAARPRASTVFTLQRALINERALAGETERGGGEFNAKAQRRKREREREREREKKLMHFCVFAPLR
ncbi:hypothetical protein [Sorangium sp. So ce693]|uniref:hypothetical protein n=1 Tax=Sorangium sp. So ce693 TaxID=3133318 RepID=UPI003F63368E